MVSLVEIKVIVASLVISIFPLFVTTIRPSVLAETPSDVRYPPPVTGVVISVPPLFES